MFTYGSICSGIEAASVAWQGLGKPLWFAEIESFPSALLAYRYPEIPNLGDMTTLPEKILNREIPAPDVLVGGTPCQAFSVAGKRESLDDERGNLTLALIHILEAIDYVRNRNGQPPCVFVWENVPGVLSTKDNAFGHLLAGLAQECQPLQPPGQDGQTLVMCIQPALSAGEFSMLNTSACHNDVRECSLWQVLETEALPKYSLSPRACQGILNQAERRQKILPDLLKQALLNIANQATPAH